MTPIFLRRFVAVAVASAFLATARAEEPAIIAKARAYLGPEAALDGVQSLFYSGTLTTADPSDPEKKTRAEMEIVFQKPQQQRIQANSDKTVEVTALDGYEAWQRVEDRSDPLKWRQTILSPEQVKRLRANTWENLWFFRGIEKAGGRLEVQETKAIDGVTCQKIAFIHAPNIIFYRYFDVATGRLVFTETESGGTIREEGEMMVGGIRFPKKLITTSRNGRGESQTVTIDFDRIVVNEPIPAQQFAVPPPKSR
jgi:outer membrane lipoprotein-sorting protein